MEQIMKHSAGGIVLDPKTEKILLTKKLAKWEFKARIIKSLLQLFNITSESAIKKFKLWWFTKGKIEKWHTNTYTALNEIEEEGGIDHNDLIMIKRLWTFTKKKFYGFKEVEMFLYTIYKEYSKLQPSDIRHIAAFIELNKAVDIMQSTEEKAFLKYIQEEIQEVLNTHKNLTTLPIKETADVTQVDVGVER